MCGKIGFAGDASPLIAVPPPYTPAAARELAVSASAVRHSVRQLDGTLGVARLQRTTRAVTPTQAQRAPAQRAFVETTKAVLRRK